MNAPAPTPTPTTTADQPYTAHVLLNTFRRMKPLEVPDVGEMTRALRRMNPEEQALVAEIGDRLIDQRELGRHGNTDRIFDEYEIPKEDRPTINRMLDAAETDDLAVSLQRRMGTDVDLPLPPPTSRDETAAAYEAHTGDSHD